MKGMAPIIVVVIALVIMLTTITGSALFLTAKSETILRTSREVEIVKGINTFELLKTSLSQSLNYASYQAFYAISRNGGYENVPAKSSNGITYWRIYDDKSGYPPNWSTTIGELARNYLNQYGAALKTSLTFIPTYDALTVSCQPSESACHRAVQIPPLVGGMGSRG